MRLRKSRTAAEEELTSCLNAGYQVLRDIRDQYTAMRGAGKYNPETHNAAFFRAARTWAEQVCRVLLGIFPTELETSSFLNPPAGVDQAAHGENMDFAGIRIGLHRRILALERIRDEALNRYTDLPLLTRLYVEDIDSFAKVRDVNPEQVAYLLEDGYLEVLEDRVQRALEAILDVPFHKPDWGGELDDLYTSNVRLHGRRIATAFLLKGRGVRHRELQIADCGKNGDQLVKLFDAPAEFFVIQFVGRVSEAVIKDVEGKIEALKSRRNAVRYMIINGQDTARLLLAYGEFDQTGGNAT